MEIFVVKILPVLTTILTLIFSYLNLFFNRFDSKFNRKHKKIEILEGVLASDLNEIRDLSNNLKRICFVERINTFYGSALDCSTIFAILKNNDPQKTIKIVQAYRRNVTIENGNIKPIGIFDNRNINWQIGFYCYFTLAFLLAILGFIKPSILSLGDQITLSEIIILRVIYFIFFLYLVTELRKFRIAKQYINNLANE